MKAILVETNGKLNHIDITELEVSFYLGGAPLTFCGTIKHLDLVVLIKEDYPGTVFNPYVIPGVSRFKGRALIIQTNSHGNPIDIDYDAYYRYVNVS